MVLTPEKFLGGAIHPASGTSDARGMVHFQTEDATISDLTTSLQNDLLTSASMFVDDIYWHGSGLVTDLLTSDKMFINQRMATLLNLPFDSGSPDDFVPVSGADQGRAGMLTQPALLWAVSDIATTSIVHRGIEVHDNIICATPITFSRCSGRTARRMPVTIRL